MVSMEGCDEERFPDSTQVCLNWRTPNAWTVKLRTKQTQSLWSLVCVATLAGNEPARVCAEGETPQTFILGVVSVACQFPSDDPASLVEDYEEAWGVVAGRELAQQIEAIT